MWDLNEAFELKKFVTFSVDVVDVIIVKLHVEPIYDDCIKSGDGSPLLTPSVFAYHPSTGTAMLIGLQSCKAEVQCQPSRIANHNRLT